MQQLLFQNHNVAFDYFKKLLVNKGYRIESVSPYNKGRHLLIKTNKGNLYCLFKHSFFHSFNFVFENFVGKNPDYLGQGESINVDYCQYAIKHNATLIYIYPEMDIYTIHPKVVRAFCLMYGLIRTQEKNNFYKKADYSGSTEQIQEREYVFPVKLLTRWK